MKSIPDFISSGITPTIKLKSGERYSETLTVGTTGTETTNLNIESYGEGAKPLFYGAVEFSDPWVDSGGGIFTNTVPDGKGNALFVDDELPLMATSSACSDGIWYKDGNDIYFKPISGDPSDYTLEYSFLDRAIFGTGKSYINVTDIEAVKMNNGDSRLAAVIFDNGSHVYIKNPVVSKSWNNAIVFSGMTDSTVENPDISDMFLSGIYFMAGSSRCKATGGSIHNIGTKTRTGSGDVYAMASGGSGDCINNIFEYTEVYDVGNESLNEALDCAVAAWGETTQTETIFRYMNIHDNAVGAINTGNHGGGSKVYGNTLLRNGSLVDTNKNGGVYVSNASLDIDDVEVYDNYMEDNISPSSQASLWAYNAGSKLNSHDNIIKGEFGKHVLIPSDFSTYIANSNKYYPEQEGVFSWKGTDYGTLSEFMSVSGETNSTIEDAE